MEKTIIKVEGMSCNHCIQAVTKAVTVLAGIDNVVVDLKIETVTVGQNLGITDVINIKAELEVQGYVVVA
ncbi:MAG: cation transporter [Synergistaceae bacterium]|nr:cation transporter [Synergistaceae bacterium]